jgi:N-acyl-D-amino-acid deacylase
MTELTDKRIHDNPRSICVKEIIQMRILFMLAIPLILLLLFSCSPQQYDHDIIIRDGLIYDGSGSPPFVADIAVDGDTISAIGLFAERRGSVEINVKGLAVTPGFINVLSWAADPLIEDGRSQSNIRQGVTLEVFGEGFSKGPLNEAMKRDMEERQGRIRYDVEWTTLNEFLHYLVIRGVSPNVASHVGASTVRIHAMGYEGRKATDEELDRMRRLVREAMEEGALGVGTALIYTPGLYADTDELIALGEIAAEYGGILTSHVRSEGNRFIESVEEMLTVARRSGVHVHIYHLKAAGEDNWHKLDTVIGIIEKARAEGLPITADMYTYTAGATGLDAAMPPWVQEGGYDAWAERLRDHAVRDRVKKEMTTPSDEWENLYLAAGSPENVILIGFRNDELKHLTGKSLAEIASMRGTSPEETAMDLVIEDGSRVSVVYFFMSEENVRKKIGLPWVTYGSDAGSLAPEGVFLESNPHPRAYGNFARLLGKYVRDEELIPLEEAIRKLTSFPASILSVERRGSLKIGYYADIVVFDPATIRDNATFEAPHAYATGVHHVLVNGVPVLKDGDHTGALPGRVVRGPGYRDKHYE